MAKSQKERKRAPNTQNIVSGYADVINSLDSDPDVRKSTTQQLVERARQLVDELDTLVTDVEENMLLDELVKEKVTSGKSTIDKVYSKSAYIGLIMSMLQWKMSEYKENVDGAAKAQIPTVQPDVQQYKTNKEK